MHFALEIFLYYQVIIIVFSIVSTIFTLLFISCFPKTAIFILKVILELAVDRSNYSHHQRSPYSEYGSYTQSYIVTRG